MTVILLVQSVKTLRHLHSAGEGVIFHTIKTMGQFASNHKYSCTHFIKTKSQVERTCPFGAGFSLTYVLLHRNIAKHKTHVLRTRTQDRNSSHICKPHCYWVLYLHVSILYSFIHSCFPFVSSSLSCQQSVQFSSSSFIHSVIHSRTSSVLFVFSVYASVSLRYMTYVLTVTLHSLDRRHFPINAVFSLNQIP